MAALFYDQVSWRNVSDAEFIPEKTTFKFLSLVLFVTWVAIHRHVCRVLKKLQEPTNWYSVCVLEYGEQQYW